MTYIYAICSRTSGKVYVGKTIDMRKRLNSHKSGSLSYISRAIHKQGWSDFVVVNLAQVDDRDAGRLEQNWISWLNTMAPHGYNLTEGGEGTVGLSYSNETRKKIAATKLGKPLSQEHRDKLSRANKGRVFSQGHTQRIIESRTKGGKWFFSEEHRRKISEALKGHTHSIETRHKMSVTGKRVWEQRKWQS